MIRAYEMPNGEKIHIASSIEDVKYCVLVNHVYEQEELWMRFDVLSLEKHMLPAGTPVVICFAPGDEDDDYKPVESFHGDLRYHMESTVRYHAAKYTPYVRLEVVSEESMKILEEQVEARDKEKQLEHDRAQFEKLKAIFWPEPEPKTYRIKAKFGRKVKAF